MGNQLFIIGATGTANPGLMAQLTALLLTSGLQVRHASRHYQGETEFEIGGPSDLAAELTGASVPPEQATLEALKVSLDAFRAEFREFTEYEQEDDKKRPAKRGPKKPKLVEEQKPEEQKPEEQKPEEQKPEEVDSEQEQEVDKAPEETADPPAGSAE